MSAGEHRPGHRRPTPMSRRQFLRRSAGAAVALPSLSAILAACSKPGTVSGGGSTGPSAFPIARQDNPVTLPMNGEPIPADTPIEKGATLQVYNWADYMWKKVLSEFEDKFDCHIEWTTFNNISEAVQKMSSGQITADVFFPTIDVLGKLVQAKLLQPLQHELIPNLPKYMWKEYQNPFYDQGWRYTVPYTIYTTGIAYRRDHISDDQVAQEGWDILWNPKYKGKVGAYDDYRETLSLGLLKNGVTDLNTGSQADITKAKEDILTLINDQNAALDINGVYVKLPDDVFSAHLAWSGDIIGAQWYMPKGVSTDVLGYWFPSDFQGPVNNDTITIPASSQNPRLAHEFLNFMTEKHYAFQNFTWNGYQPPLTSMNPDTLIPKGYVPKTVPEAIVRPEQFDKGLFELELSPSVDEIWLNAWDEIKAGA
jgi:spermidine/putrescine transport system substrate-binding protein